MEQRYVDRLWAGIDKRGPDECWPWTRSCSKGGYGQLWVSGTVQYVHRLVVEAPAGSEVLHSCDNPPCCNPAHLTVGTHAANMADHRRKGRARNDKTDRERDQCIFDRFTAGEHADDLAREFGFSDGPGIYRVVRRVRRREAELRHPQPEVDAQGSGR